ncbi:MAG TPA: hypothetical protein VF074_22265 [Pyrinomonadaceae bacterium]
MKETLAADNFDNGRTPEQLRISFQNSYAAVVAYDADRIVGTARALCDDRSNKSYMTYMTYKTYTHHS